MIITKGAKTRGENRPYYWGVKRCYEICCGTERFVFIGHHDRESRFRRSEHEWGVGMSTKEDDQEQAEMVIFRYEREVLTNAKIKGGKREVAIELIEEGWSADHAKLVYLISNYGKPAVSAKETETWIRETPLTVLIFEGATNGLFTFDYAPMSTTISQDGRSRRVWLNISRSRWDACLAIATSGFQQEPDR